MTIPERERPLGEALTVVWREYTGSDRDLALKVPFTPEGFMNATVMAEKFGKRAYDYLRTDRAANHIRATHRRIYGEDLPAIREDVRNVESLDTPLVIVRQGTRGVQGTWLHPKLVIDFGRWLSPDFGVWCDSQIEEILRPNGPFPLRAVDEDVLAPIPPDRQLLTALGEIFTSGLAVIGAQVGDLRSLLERQMAPDLATVKDTTMETNRDVKAIGQMVSEVQTSVAKHTGERKYPNADGYRLAWRTVETRHQGVCPCCGVTRILDANGLPAAGCVWDHAHNRASGDVKDGWPVCEACNKKLGPPVTTGYRKELRFRFDAFQFNLRLVQDEIASEKKARRRDREESETCSGFLFAPEEV